MGRRHTLKIFSLIVLTVCLTSTLFLIFDIARYLHVINVMFDRIFHAIRIIIFLVIIMFFSVLILLRK
jgi:hypothetical protein